MALFLNMLYMFICTPKYSTTSPQKTSKWYELRLMIKSLSHQQNNSDTFLELWWEHKFTLMWNFLHLFVGIFASSCTKTPSSMMFEVFCETTSFFKSHKRFSMRFKSGDWEGHSKTLQDLFLKQDLADLKMCLGSLFCWKVQWSPRHFWTEDIPFLFKMIPIFMGIHDVYYVVKIACSCIRKTFPHYQWPTSMLNCGVGILLVVILACLRPDIPLVHVSKQF